MTISSINPATEEELQRYDQASDEKISQLLDTAIHAQKGWRVRDFSERAKLMQRLADRLEARKRELAELASSEMGKLSSEALGEVEKCAWVCRYYAEHAERMLGDTPLDDDNDKRSFVSYHPLGVVLAVMPWNFPYWQVFRCAVPAIMAGNAVVLKHASNVTGCALAIEELFREVDAPVGLFTTLIISGSRASELLADPRIAAASVTGSEKAGGSVASAAGLHIKPTVLELGGSDPFIVLDMDDADNIIANAVNSRFQNCGQSCIAAKRFIVSDSIFESFMDAFVSKVQRLAIGMPNDPATGLVPMARGDLRDELHEQVVDAREKGASIITGGEIPTGSGYFYPPTVITDLTPNCRLYAEEAFGPVAGVFRVRDAQEAVAMANASPFGLGGSVWCSDIERGIDVARQVESGAVYVNRMMASDPRLPFGGIKLSGYGRELSTMGIHEFVNRKTISAQL